MSWSVSMYFWPSLVIVWECRYDHAIDYEMFYVIDEYFERKVSSGAVDVFESPVSWYLFERAEIVDEGSPDYDPPRFGNNITMSDSFKYSISKIKWEFVKCALSVFS